MKRLLFIISLTLPLAIKKQAMDYLREIEDIKNPAYLWVSANKKFVYSANENDIAG